MVLLVACDKQDYTSSPDSLIQKTNLVSRFGAFFRGLLTVRGKKLRETRLFRFFESEHGHQERANEHYANWHRVLQVTEHQIQIHHPA